MFHSSIRSFYKNNYLVPHVSWQKVCQEESLEFINIQDKFYNKTNKLNYASLTQMKRLFNVL